MALCVAAAAALAGGAGSASADTGLEGVWSFNGGSVAIQAQPDGTYAGTVLKATKFAECEHEVGERMWTGLTAQPDGSYWGLHQWFYKGTACKPNPTPGPTAWRLMASGTGHYLEVCLSEPGHSQPTIPVEGEPTGSTFGCVDSALVSPLPTPTTEEFLGRRGTAAAVCLPTNKLRIRIRNPTANPLARISIVVKGGGVRKVFRFTPRPRSFVAVVSLLKLPAATVRATVRLTTVLGAHLRHRRVYHRC